MLWEHAGHMTAVGKGTVIKHLKGLKGSKLRKVDKACALSGQASS